MVPLQQNNSHVTTPPGTMDDMFMGTPYLPVPADHVEPPSASSFRAFPPAPASHAEIFNVGWKGRARGLASTPPVPTDPVPEMSETLTLSHLDSSQPAALSAARTLERARDTVRVLKDDLATERSQRAQVAAQLQASHSTLTTQQSKLAESQRTVAELNEKVTFLQRSLEDNERSRQSLLKAARRQRERADQAESEMTKLRAQHEEQRQQWSIEAESKLGDVAARWQEAMHNERIQFDVEREQDRRVLDDASKAIEHVQLQIAAKDQAILDAMSVLHSLCSQDALEETESDSKTLNRVLADVTACVYDLRTQLQLQQRSLIDSEHQLQQTQQELSDLRSTAQQELHDLRAAAHQEIEASREQAVQQRAQFDEYAERWAAQLRAKVVEWSEERAHLESMIAVSHASHESDIATEMHDMHQQLTHARTQTAAAEDALQLALSECEERIAAAEATSASAASDAAKAMAGAQQSFARELHQRVAHHAAQQAAMKQEHAVALAALRSQNDALQIELLAVKSELSSVQSQMATLHAESVSLKEELSRVNASHQLTVERLHADTGSRQLSIDRMLAEHAAALAAQRSELLGGAAAVSAAHEAELTQAKAEAANWQRQLEQLRQLHQDDCTNFAEREKKLREVCASKVASLNEDLQRSQDVIESLELNQKRQSQQWEDRMFALDARQRELEQRERNVVQPISIDHQSAAHELEVRRVALEARDAELTNREHQLAEEAERAAVAVKAIEPRVPKPQTVVRTASLLPPKSAAISFLSPGGVAPAASHTSSTFISQPPQLNVDAFSTSSSSLPSVSLFHAPAISPQHAQSAVAHLDDEARQANVKAATEYLRWRLEEQAHSKQSTPSHAESMRQKSVISPSLVQSNTPSSSLFAHSHHESARPLIGEPTVSLFSPQLASPLPLRSAYPAHAPLGRAHSTSEISSISHAVVPNMPPVHFQFPQIELPPYIDAHHSSKAASEHLPAQSLLPPTHARSQSPTPFSAVPVSDVSSPAVVLPPGTAVKRSKHFKTHHDFFESVHPADVSTDSIQSDKPMVALTPEPERHVEFKRSFSESSERGFEKTETSDLNKQVASPQEGGFFIPPWLVTLLKQSASDGLNRLPIADPAAVDTNAYVSEPHVAPAVSSNAAFEGSASAAAQPVIMAPLSSTPPASALASDLPVVENVVSSTVAPVPVVEPAVEPQLSVSSSQAASADVQSKLQRSELGRTDQLLQQLAQSFVSKPNADVLNSSSRLPGQLDPSVSEIAAQQNKAARRALLSRVDMVIQNVETDLLARSMTRGTASSRQ